MTSRSRLFNRPDRPLYSVIVAVAIFLGLVNTVVYFASPATKYWVVPWYLPTVHTFVALCSFCVAFLAIGRHQVLKYPAPFWIGVAYLSYSIFTIFRLLVFPTLPGNMGIIEAVPTLSPWLVNVQMTTLATCVTAAPFTRAPRERWSSWLGTLTAVATALLAGLTLVKLDTKLPVLITSGRFTGSEIVLLLCISLLLLVSAAVATWSYLGSGDNLFAYTALSQLAVTSSVAMNALGAAWFTLPFYLGRNIVVIGALIMLFGLLSDYVRLARKEQEKSQELAKRSEELARSEERLRYNEATLQMAISSTGMGTFEFEPQTGKLTWSAQAKANFGLAPDATESYQLFISALHPEDREEAQEALKRALQPGSDGFYRAEYRTIGIEDGKERWLMARGRVLFDATGAPTRVLGTTLDITEPKKAEARLRRIFDSGMIGLIYWNMHGDILDANDAFLNVLGRSRAELEAGTIKWSELTPPEFDALDQYALGELRATGLDTPYEKEFFRSDGTRVPILIGAATLPEAPEEGVAFVLDITERKKAEEEVRQARSSLELRVQERTEELNRALQHLRSETEERIRAVEELRVREQMLMQQSRLAAMGEMLVNISHQWRQPLNVLGLILQNLARSYERGALSVEVVRKSVRRGTELIEHMSKTIADFSAYLNPDKTKLSFDVGEVINNAVSMVRESLHGIEIKVHTPDEPVFAEGYRNEYAQVVINILVNARDALRDKSVPDARVTIGINRQGDKSVVTILDNAGGIAADVLEKIFDPYFTTKEPGRGTGIGLFMSKAIIEKSMGGKLTARNADGGAEFRIEV
ncbi:PAS domain S-box protein [Geomonas subterranea]|uniref:histidine kinase n=1 Tax=Geomonas subterranea TaxID=2847989 RepID=A0ABX8LKB8_9BACT|nr:PAS domain-containing sensor histidine kinase [Geomonas subterranea]QXE91811.1 PAS domain S-box protein [Geomonas subterranea]QXM10096.1 PAS domain S-box protein [Geomonas subterranea]